MIKSKYLKTLLFSLPGAYLALWLSRIALEIVNNSQYYYGLIFCFISLFIGYAAGLLVSKRHKNLSWESLTLLGISSFCINEINLLAKMAILGFVGGLIFYGIIKEYRKFFVGGFIIGGVSSFLLGGDLFVSYSKAELFIGGIVFLYSLRDMKKVKFKWVLIILNLLLFGFFVTNFLQNYTNEKNAGNSNILISNTALGKVRTVIGDNQNIQVYDHRNNLIDYRDNYLHNNNLVLPLLLQRNAKNLHLLYIGYAPSLMPIEIFNSPLVEKLDVLYWGGVDINNKKPKLNHRFPGTEILRAYFNQNKRYDIIIIENLPRDDYIAQRIFLRYSKKLLKDSKGIIAFPEYLMRTYDGRYVKPYRDNTLVFLTNAITEENGNLLKERYLNLLNSYQSNTPEVDALLDEVIPEQFVIPEEIRATEVSAQNTINLELNSKVIKLTLLCVLIAYLIFRIFCSRHKDNNYLFYGFENGYAMLVISLSVIVMIAEYRLVYWFFAPALLSLLGLLMISYRSKIFEFCCNLSLTWVFAYLLIPELILTLQPFVFLLPFWVLSLMTAGNTIKDIGNRTNIIDANIPRYCTLLGVFVGLLLMILCRENAIFPYLIYGAMLFRVMYLLKI